MYITRNGKVITKAKKMIARQMAANGPVSDFSFSPTSGVNPLEVTFEDLSEIGDTNIVSWSWTFGDGKTSSLQNPVNTYQFPGEYTITLTVTDAEGLISSISKALTVTESTSLGPTASFNVVPQGGEVPLNVVCESTSTTGDEPITLHFWDWGDGTTTSGGYQNVPHTYNSPGTFTITLTVTDGNGKSSQATAQVVVSAVQNPAPVARFTMTPSGGESPLPVDFDASTSSDNSAIVSYSWNFGDGNTDTGVNPSHIYQSAGSYTVTLTVTDDEGKSGQTQKTISVQNSGQNSGEVISGLIHRVYAPDFTTGVVSDAQIRDKGQFEYTTKGFGNGYKNRHLVECVNNPSGLPAGKWLKTIRPGGLDAHTYTKAIRAINTEGQIHPNGFTEFWVKIEWFMTEDFVIQNQGKLGYSWSNPNGVPPGSNPSPNPEFLFHWFSPNHSKSTGLWPSTKPNSGPYNEQQMVLGLDVYANDSRISNNYSEPVFLVEDADAGNYKQKLFDKGKHCAVWAYIKLNDPGQQNGKLRGWWSEDGGQNYKKGVDILDMDWRGNSSVKLQDVGFVQFYGGSGLGFEPGGGPSKNTGVTLQSKDYHFFIRDMRTQSANPLPSTFV